MSYIQKKNGKFIVTGVVKNFGQQANAALNQIDADRATLADSPTNADVIAVLDSTLERQAKEIKVLRKLLRQR